MKEEKREDGERQDSLFDRLTGIYNRPGFYMATERLLKAHPEEEFVVAYWNVQKFKVINELFGRSAGDSLLMHMADMMRYAVRMSEQLYTYGRLERDNFVMCFPVRFILDKSFVHSGELTWVSDGVEYHFTSCYGLYIVKDRSLTIAAMVDRGRIAMETVKQNYVKPFAYYDESMKEKMVMEQILMSDCRNAVREEQFEVYYQPICNTADGTLASAEALVRWRHPEKGMIAPGEFIPVFEKNGFVSLLDRYVWERVCRMLAKRIGEKKRIVPVSVNVSRVDFYNPALCDEITGLVEGYGIDPEALQLEVTESAYSNNPNRVAEAVERLQNYGFRILMDDFGSGYSSLNTLKDLPVDILKIDMKFMDDLDKGGKSAIILESVVQMAGRMKLRVVAEGVETERDLAFLRKMGCDYIQGFYFYRPMPEREFLGLLDQMDGRRKKYE